MSNIDTEFYDVLSEVDLEVDLDEIDKMKFDDIKQGREVYKLASILGIKEKNKFIRQFFIICIFFILGVICIV